MKRIILAAISLLAFAASGFSKAGDKITMTHETLLDKIKGGWAGQTIGCTYGGPTEFYYRGRMIPDSISIDWPEHYIKWYFRKFPGLYDDVYMDLTFVDVFDRLGLDAPVEEFAKAFAYAKYPLWHANLQGRVNIMQGIMPPESGYWKNNPHADDIDFQIEADFAGLMSPAMVNAAAFWCDGIGHIMNYGDGWYGGVWVAAMYSLAFVYDDVETLVRKSLEVLPEQSRYYHCISSVLKWWETWPDDWRKTWTMVQEELAVAQEADCPDEPGNQFRIDADINGAYIAIGLLYGGGDFERTMEIATRCGQDSDCNPASACGVLATMKGYHAIPRKYLADVQEIEDVPFEYTDISLNKVYRMSYNQALEVIRRNGGSVGKSKVTIPLHPVEPVRYEKSFEGIRFKEAVSIDRSAWLHGNNLDLEFDGCGIVLAGRLAGMRDGDYEAVVKVVIDGERMPDIHISEKVNSSPDHIYHNFDLGQGRHKVHFRVLNPREDKKLRYVRALIYEDESVCRAGNAPVPCPCIHAGGNSRYVNVFMGTGGDFGMVSPAACCPFGMISLCPDAVPPLHMGYDYDNTLTSGISLNRVSGVGGNGSGGNVRVKPGLADVPLNIVKASETAFPGYYETEFDNGVRVRLTSGIDTAFEQYDFSDSRCGSMLYIDFDSAIDHHDSSCGWNVVDDRTIEGWYQTATVCRAGLYRQWFTLTASAPFRLLESDGTTAVLDFDAEIVELRIAVSGVSREDARKVSVKSGSIGFDEALAEAVRAWDEKLSKIDVRGASYEQKVLFYTSLYRLYHSPMAVSSCDGRFRGTDNAVHEMENGGTYYSCWSMWDTFRTKFPMFSIIEPEVTGDIVRSLVKQYETGKENWATKYECCPTVRTEHSAVVLLDAVEKGIVRPSELLAGYEGMKYEADRQAPRKSPDNLMETSYDLWAVSKIAAWLGFEDDAAKYAKEADEMFTDVWKRVFMDITPDFAQVKGSGLYQGSKWQYRWAAAPFIEKTSRWVPYPLQAEQLDEFFAGNFFNQCNEPDIHYPFLYTAFGYPGRTQETVRRLLTDDSYIHLYCGDEPYVGRAFRNDVHGYAPQMDEDDGAMSAWYMFASLGFYPLVPGTDGYIAVSPLFDDVTMKLGNSAVHIRTEGRKDYSDTVKSVTVNGEEVRNWIIPHSAFAGPETTIVYRY